MTPFARGPASAGAAAGGGAPEDGEPRAPDGEGVADADTNTGTGTGTGTDGVARAPVLRPFLLTAGRVAGAGDGAGAALPVETQVVSTAEGLAALDTLSFECRDIVALCRRPQSLAEIAAALRLHLNVVRVLAADLQAGGRLSVYVPGAGTARDISVLRRVIDGLRGIPDTGRAPGSGRAGRDAE